MKKMSKFAVLVPILFFILTSCLNKDESPTAINVTNSVDSILCECDTNVNIKRGDTLLVRAHFSLECKMSHTAILESLSVYDAHFHFALAKACTGCYRNDWKFLAIGTGSTDLSFEAMDTTWNGNKDFAVGVTVQ